MSLISRFLNVLRSDRVDDDLDDELRFHVEQRTRALIDRGATPEAAAAEAQRRLGNHLAVRERSRDVKLLGWLEALLKDLRFGLRMLRKDFVVSAAAVLSLSLAMGASIAAFALIDALILRPLPVAEPDHLVVLTYPQFDDRRVRSEGEEEASFSYPFFERLRTAGRPRIDLFAVSYQGPQPAQFGDSGGVDERVTLQYVSGDTFDRLGLVPSAGRLLSKSDDLHPGAHPVAVISHLFWARRFGGNRDLVGRWFTLNDKPFQIIGVAPEGFTGVEPGIRTDVWIPMMMGQADSLREMGWQWFRILGRLRPGVGPEDARAALQPAFSAVRRERLREFSPEDSQRLRDRYLRTPLFLRSAATGPSRLRTDFARPLWILTAVVSLVLLTACSNVANLLTARTAAREREMALRLSIGAGRARLVQQLLIESGLLAGSACAMGLLIARAVTPVIVDMLGTVDMPAYLNLRSDWRVLAFAVLMAFGTTMLFGLMPALRASAVSPIAALKTQGARVSSRLRLLRPLLSAQVAFSVAVLFLAGLLTLSFVRLMQIDVGFRAPGLSLVTVRGGLAGTERAVQQALVGNILGTLRQIRGVRAASASSWALFEGSGWSLEVRVQGKPVDRTDVYYLGVSPGFMATMGIPVLQGRDLAPRDAEIDPATAVLVNETFVRRFFPGERALERDFGRTEDRGRLQTQHIVGIVADAKYRDLKEPPPPTVYVPMQPMGPFGGLTLQVRSAVPIAPLLPQIQSALTRIHPSLKIGGVYDQQVFVDNTMLRERLLALLASFFALVSLALAIIGLYGVMSYSVVQRTREIGIRVALGARLVTVLRAVLSDAFVVTAFGVVAGLAGGMLLSRFVRTLLYEVTPFDAASIALPIAVLVIAAFAAAILPARRAARVDPIEALRYE